MKEDYSQIYPLDYQPQHALGQRCIIHTGVWGMDFYKALHDYLCGGEMHPDIDPRTIREFYDSIMKDLVRAMGLPEPMALQHINQLPAKDSIDLLGWLINIDAIYEEIHHLVRTWLVFLYQKVIFNQIRSGQVLYIPDQIGLDYLAVTEATLLTNPG